MRTSCEMMNTEHNLGLSETDIQVYDPTHLQKIKESFSALFFCDYLNEFVFSLMDVN